MVSEPLLQSFIASSFRSVWALEVLKHLAANRDSTFSDSDLIDQLRVSDVVVSNSVAALAAGGLILIDSDGRIRFGVLDPGQLELVDAAIDLYRTSPDKVRRMIVSGAAPGITAFADAFRLRKE
jgi:hypothetical protein